MATYTSAKAASTVPTRTPVGLTSVHADYTTTATLALNDVIQMVRVPARARIVDIILETSDLDTNGTPTITLDVGDGNDTDRFIDGSTIGRTGGIERINVVAAGTTAATKTGTGFIYSAEDTIDVLVQAAPATSAAAGALIRMTVVYDMMQA